MPDPKEPISSEEDPHLIALELGSSPAGGKNRWPKSGETDP